MKRILFQGDSITDAGRARDWDEGKGFGYPALVSGKLGYDCPGQYEFFNRGIGGNRVVDLLARVKCDMINLHPDVMSILIGVNDVWHEISFQNGISAQRYRHLYDLLVGELLEALPDLKLMLLEPFVLKGIETAGAWEVFRPEVERRAEAAAWVAEKYKLPFIPLQKRFDEVCAQAPESYWLFDGVHPTSAGHELIAREWLAAFQNI